MGCHVVPEVLAQVGGCAQVGPRSPCPRVSRAESRSWGPPLSDKSGPGPEKNGFAVSTGRVDPPPRGASGGGQLVRQCNTITASRNPTAARVTWHAEPLPDGEDARGAGPPADRQSPLTNEIGKVLKSGSAASGSPPEA